MVSLIVYIDVTFALFMFMFMSRIGWVYARGPRFQGFSSFAPSGVDQLDGWTSTDVTGGTSVLGAGQYSFRYLVSGISGYQQPHIGPNQGVQQETGTCGP